MDVDEIDKQVCKVSRISNDSNNKIGQNGGGRGGGGRGRGEHPYREDEEEEGGGGRLGTWHTSRIFRVSSASGGKDRHSKVFTAKGLRDRRVRLSVSTAIQFYDLQDRLGYDQPSKAVEWLIKAAADAIAELPSLDTKFPQPIQQQSEERDEEDVELLHEADTQHHHHHHHQQQQLSRSACSSTSETSKGGGGSSSVLSLTRTESRVKARERARERAAKDKMKDDNESHIAPHQHHQNSQPSSFTELLTGGGAGGGGTRQHFPQTTSFDYFSSGLFGQRNYFSLGGFSGQNQHLAMAAQHPFSITSGDHQQHHNPHHHPEMQHFSFLPDHMIPEAAEAEAVTGSDDNLNFSISSGLAGYNRGTLQSNSPSSLPHSNLQRFSSHVEGTNIPFFIGNVAAAPSSAAPSDETQFQAGFDARLQLRYGDGSSRHSDLKGKGKT